MGGWGLSAVRVLVHVTYHVCCGAQSLDSLDCLSALDSLDSLPRRYLFYFCT